MWEAADILRLSRLGPYVVVAAELAVIGRLALPGIENHLRAADVSSAWRLFTDLEVGVVEVRKPKHLDLLIATLARYARTRVGISPTYDDLQDTAYALRFARIAMTGSRLDDGSSVTIFDRSPLVVTAVGAPDIMQRVSRNVLGGLDSLPAEERGRVLDTLEAWLANGGSASKTAQRLFCHPNTVRHRLRRIEEHTGRSLTDPLGTSELCVALQTERRLPRFRPVRGRAQFTAEFAVCWAIDSRATTGERGVVLVWGRDTADRQVKGFLVERGAPGFRAQKIEGKGALRAVWQARIDLQDVRVPESSRLPGAHGFADVGGILVGTRSACAWMALGHAVAGFDTAVTYAKRRTQFGRALGILVRADISPAITCP